MAAVNLGRMREEAEKRLLPIRQKWKRCFEKKTEAVYMAAGGRLYGLKLKEGAPMAKGSAPLPHIEKESAVRALSHLKEEGVSASRTILLLSGSDLRYASRRYPEMTREDLEETFLWDEDRVFRMNEPMALAARPLSHTAEGWQAELAAVKKETLAGWKEAFQEAHMPLDRALPVMTLAGEKSMVLYGRKDSGFLVVKNGSAVEYRVIHREKTEETLSFFGESMIRALSLRNLSVSFVPLAGCPQEQWPFWEKALRESVHTIEQVLAEKEMTVPVSFIPEKEGSFWPLFFSLARGIPGARLDFLARERAKKQAEEAALWKGKAALCLGAAALATGAAYAGWAEINYRETEGAWEKAAPAIAEKKRFENEAREEREAAEELKEREGKTPQWARRLILLSEILPEDAVLDRIESGPAGTIIQGRAKTGGDVTDFEKSLSAAWQGEAHVEERKSHPGTEWLDFRIRFSQGKNSSSTASGSRKTNRGEEGKDV